MSPEDDEVLAQMDAQLDGVVRAAVTGAVDMSKLAPGELMRIKEHHTRRLAELGEIQGQRTAEGRDLHSELAACITELRRRRIM